MKVKRPEMLPTFQTLNYNSSDPHFLYRTEICILALIANACMIAGPRIARVPPQLSSAMLEFAGSGE
jgi:hypothetical protein